jgi:hypothetical protein
VSRQPPRQVTVQTHEVPRPSESARWQTGALAVSTVLARLAELYARSLRVEVARRARNAENLGRALGKLPPR